METDESAAWLSRSIHSQPATSDVPPTGGKRSALLLIVDASGTTPVQALPHVNATAFSCSSKRTSVEVFSGTVAFCA